jgi:hypothetical protein
VSSEWQCFSTDYNTLARFARFLRQDELLPERERIKDIMDSIRAKYPEQAKAADDYVDSLTLGFVLAEVLPFSFSPSRLCPLVLPLNFKFHLSFYIF